MSQLENLIKNSTEEIINANFTESRTLAETYKNARGLTKFYFYKLRNEDITKEFEINGIRLNSASWLMTHLVWAEYFLLVEGLSGEKNYEPWMREVQFGTNPADRKNIPSIDEVLNKMEEVHALAQDKITALTSEELNKPNLVSLTFAGGDSKRNIINHAIRHEASHSGHLGWLCKLFGIKTI